MIGVRKVILALFVVSGACLAGASEAARGAVCEKCGCEENVRCVCRPIYTTKYIEITCWDSVCEDVCLPPRSSCKKGCGNCDDANCFPANGGNGTAGTGKGIKIRSCNKLVRKTYLQPVPTVIWVVEYLCERCRRGNEAEAYDAHYEMQSPTGSAKNQSDIYDLWRTGRESHSTTGEDYSSHF